MEVVGGNTLLPGDPRLIDHIVCELKSQGIFDQFRKECIADVDTKPAYQNLRQRVEGSVTGFLKTQNWRPDMNKNQLREMLRKNIYESGFLETGVERIVDQVVNPKINTVFLPQVEEVVYKFLGLAKPTRNTPYNHPSNGPLSINTVDLLPTDLDPISPDSEVLVAKVEKTNEHSEETAADNLDDSKNDEFESPPFEPINEQTVYGGGHDESSNDSRISGISGLTSHDSNISDAGAGADKNVPDVNNADSQLSKVSSNSRLSIVTTDSKHTPEKMDISDDNTEDCTVKIEENTSLIGVKEERDELEEIRMEINGHIQNKLTVVEVEKEIKAEVIEETSENKINEQVEDITQKAEDINIKEETIKEEIKDETPNVKEEINKEETKKSDKHRHDSEKRKDKHSDKERKDDKKSDKKDKYKSSSSSSRDKDKNRDKSRESKSSKDKDSKSRDNKSKDDKNKDDKSKSSSTSSTSKHSSRDRNRSSSSKSDSKSSKDSKSKDSKSSSRKSDSSKSRSRDHSKSDSTKHSSSHTSKDRKSSSSKDYRDKKDPKKSTKDDHSSSRDKKNETRRSADRDSNDGSSNLNNTNNTATSAAKDKEGSTESSNKSKSDNSDFSGSNSGDSGQSDNMQVNQEQTTTTTTLDEVTLNPSAAQIMKMKKPKIASNIFEVRKLMRIRKKMEKMEKKRQRQQELAAENKMRDSPQSIDDTDSVDSESLVNAPPSNIDELVKNIASITGEDLSDQETNTNSTAIVSKERWDAIEAKLSQSAHENVDFNLYAEDTGDSSSSVSKQDDASIKRAKRLSEEEDCLYFSNEVSPTTERFLQSIERFKSIETKRLKNNFWHLEDSDQKIKGKKRKLDGEIDTENNNKKLNAIGEDVLDTLTASPSGSNLSNGSIDVPIKPKSSRVKKTKKNTTVNCSPSSDIDSENLGETKRPSRASILKNQRYSSDDLYKPRPIVSGSSRRQRGLLNNTDKKN